MNDGSPDNCKAICEEYEKKDNRVKLINKENGGLSSARNTGLDYISGEYVIFVDSDDYISNKMVEVFIQKAKETNADIVIGKHQNTYSDGRIDKSDVQFSDRIYTGREAMKKMFDPNGIGWNAWGKMYKAELFSSLRYTENIYWEDMDIAYRLYDKCNKIIEISDPLYYYYIRDNSITQSKSSKRAIDAVNNTEKMIEFYKNNCPENVDDAFAFYAKIAPNFLVTLSAKKEAMDIQKKCVNAIRQYTK